MWPKILLCLLIIYINKPLTYYENNTINETGYILEIKEIDLYLYFDDNTTLNEGLELHEISQKGGPFIISGHSGKGELALFNDLEYLSKETIINLYHDNYKKTFLLKDIIYYKKFSNVVIPNDDNYLYLITCDKYDMQKQLIISSKLAKTIYF